jgi:hypothetical protein
MRGDSNERKTSLYSIRVQIKGVKKLVNRGSVGLNVAVCTPPDDGGKRMERMEST